MLEKYQLGPQQLCDEGSIIRQRKVKFPKNYIAYSGEGKAELIEQIHWKLFWQKKQYIQSRKQHGSPGRERKYSWSQDDSGEEDYRGRGGAEERGRC